MLEGIHHIYLVNNGKLTPAGRFRVKNNSLDYLEDHHGLLKENFPEGKIDSGSATLLHSPPPHVKIAHQDLIRDGHHLDLIPEAEMGPLPTKEVISPTKQVKPAIFHYKPLNETQPSILESKNSQLYLNSKPLQEHETAALMDNLKHGLASIVYHPMANDIQKMEDVFTDLKKYEAKNQEKSVSEETIDPMTGLQNQLAYKSFNQPGVYANLSINDLKYINDTYGYDKGDRLVASLGEGLKNIPNAQVFRRGGNSFIVHSKDPGTAYMAIRELRHYVENMAPIGDYKVSFSVGFGENAEAATTALEMAKMRRYSIDLGTGKINRLHEVGNTPCFGHSLIPEGHGSVPLDDDDYTHKQFVTNA